MERKRSESEDFERDYGSKTQRAQSDAVCKQVLGEKIILGWILHGCVEEFRDIDPETIATRYIEGEPQISEVSVMRSDAPGRIRGLSTEDSTTDEGTVTYDIRFVVTVPCPQPDQPVERMQMIINMEAQKDFYLGYPLVTRAQFYGSRLISAQYGTEFVAPHYGNIKKVYSIWVCLNPPKGRENTITEYFTNEKNIIGEVKEDPWKYQLCTVVMVCLGNRDDARGQMLSMLDVLFSEQIRKDKKERILRDEFHVVMSDKMKGAVSQMCNFSEGYFDRGMEKGIGIGRAEGILDTMLSAIRSIMDKMSSTPDEAMDLLSVPEADRPKYRRLLEENNVNH